MRHAVAVRATRPDIVQRQLPAPVSPLHALSVLRDCERPVLARFHDHTIVAADPTDVAIGETVWDALRIPCAGPSTGVLAAAGAWIGLLSYDLAGTIEHLPAPIADGGGPRSQPSAGTRRLPRSTTPAAASCCRVPEIAPPTICVSA